MHVCGITIEWFSYERRTVRNSNKFTFVQYVNDNVTLGFAPYLSHEKHSKNQTAVNTGTKYILNSFAKKLCYVFKDLLHVVFRIPSIIHDTVAHRYIKACQMC